MDTGKVGAVHTAIVVAIISKLIHVTLNGTFSAGVVQQTIFPSTWEVRPVSWFTTVCPISPGDMILAAEVLVGGRLNAFEFLITIRRRRAEALETLPIDGRKIWSVGNWPVSGLVLVGLHRLVVGHSWHVVGEELDDWRQGLIGRRFRHVGLEWRLVGSWQGINRRRRRGRRSLFGDHDLFIQPKDHFRPRGAQIPAIGATHCGIFLRWRDHDERGSSKTRGDLILTCCSNDKQKDEVRARAAESGHGGGKRGG